MASKQHIRTMVFCPVKKKMVDKGTEQRLDASGSPMIIPPLKPFISPITGEEITCREQLRKHNRDHNVTNAQDYSPEFMAKRAKQRNDRANGDDSQSKRERIETIRRVMEGTI